PSWNDWSVRCGAAAGRPRMEPSPTPPRGDIRGVANEKGQYHRRLRGGGGRMNAPLILIVTPSINATGLCAPSVRGVLYDMRLQGRLPVDLSPQPSSMQLAS